MLHHVEESARAAGLANVTTLAGAAEELDVPPESFDAVICRLGLMLFVAPARALATVRRALRPGGKLAVMVFSTPPANPFMARPMAILLRHAGKAPPAPGRPGIFSLGAPGILERMLEDAELVDVSARTVAVPLRMASAGCALAMMQAAFGAYRAVISDRPEAVREAAWAEVAQTLQLFDTLNDFVAPAEVLVAAGARPK
jgi:hypothetical protein